jgi:hypothetical protein
VLAGARGAYCGAYRSDGSPKETRRDFIDPETTQALRSWAQLVKAEGRQGATWPAYTWIRAGEDIGESRRRAAVYPIRFWTAAILITVATSACTGGATSTNVPRRTPTPAATMDVSRLALQAAEARRDLLLGGDIRTNPLIVNWSQVETGSFLAGAQNAAFCSSLDNSHAGDALSSLVELGLNALSVKLRHKPLPDETGNILDLAATFATKSCPLWIPVVNPPPSPRPTPAPDWRPAGFLEVIGDPDLVWRWSDKASYNCSSAVRRCWQIDVYARYGCGSLEGILAVKDSSNVVLETQRAVSTNVTPEQVAPLGFRSNQADAAKGTLTHLTCT